MDMIQFKYKFEPEQSYSYSVDITGFVNVETPMGTLENPIEIFLKINQKIVSVEDGLGIIDVVINKAEAGKKMAAVPLPKTGAVSTMSMTETGKVKWLSGDQGWQGSEYSQMQFPKNSIKIGDIWTQIAEQTAGSVEPLKTRYTYTGADNNIACFVSEMFTGQFMKDDFNLVGKGTFTFDMNEGWILQTKNLLKHSYTMPIPEDPSMLMTTETALDITMSRI